MALTGKMETKFEKMRPFHKKIIRINILKIICTPFLCFFHSETICNINTFFVILINNNIKYFSNFLINFLHFNYFKIVGK